MISLLLLPLLLLPSIQGQTCDMAGLEERMVDRMEERMEDMEKKMRKKEEEMEAKLVAVKENAAELRKEMEAKLEEKEAVLRKELASKEEMGRALTKGLRDLPYLTFCAYQDSWTSDDSTITYDSFLTNFNNGDRPGGADGQLDLGTGVFTCLSAGIYSITFSGFAALDPAEAVRVFIYLNGVHVLESYWVAYTTYDTIGNRLSVPGSRSLVSVHPGCASQTHLILTDAAPATGRHPRAQD